MAVPLIPGNLNETGVAHICKPAACSNLASAQSAHRRGEKVMADGFRERQWMDSR